MNVTPDATPGVFLLGSGPVVEPDLTWHPGAGAAKVVVSEPSTTLQAVWDDQIRADYTVNIQEVT